MRRYTLLILGCVALVGGSGGATPASLLDPLVAKDYRTVLTAFLALRDDLLYRQDLGTATAVVISMQKQAAWDDPAMSDVIRKLRRTGPGQWAVDGLGRVVRGDLEGLSEVFRGDRVPKEQEVAAVAAMLRDHGYADAATGLTVVADGDTATRLSTWLRLSGEVRKGVDAAMARRYRPRSTVRRAFIEQAQAMLIRRDGRPPVPADSVVDFLAAYGKPGQWVGMSDVLTLYEHGKRAEALRLASALADGGARDCRAVVRSVRAAIAMGGYPEAHTMLKSAMERVESPFVAEVREEYGRFILTLTKRGVHVNGTPALNDWAVGDDLLSAGDALRILGRADDAIAKYRAVLDDAGIPLTRRWEAWRGLMLLRPEKAGDDAQILLPYLHALGTEPRSALVAWAGWQIHALILPEPDNPLIPPARLGGTQATFTLGILERQETITSAALLLSDLLTADPAGLIIPRAEWSDEAPTLQLAIIAALARKDDLAIDMLTRELEYELPVPPGGWDVIADRVHPANVLNPKRITVPTPSAREDQLLRLAGFMLGHEATLGKAPDGRRVVSPLFMRLLRECVARACKVGETKGDVAYEEWVSRYVAAFFLTIDPLPRPVWSDGPPQPVRPIDEAALREVIDLLHRAASCPRLWAGTDLFIPLCAAAREASNPLILDLVANSGTQLHRQMLMATGNREGADRQLIKLAWAMRGRGVADHTGRADAMLKRCGVDPAKANGEMGVVGAN